jgi:hypothetical protein
MTIPVSELLLGMLLLYCFGFMMFYRSKLIQIRRDALIELDRQRERDEQLRNQLDIFLTKEVVKYYSNFIDSLSIPPQLRPHFNIYALALHSQASRWLSSMSSTQEAAKRFIQEDIKDACRALEWNAYDKENVKGDLLALREYIKLIPAEFLSADQQHIKEEILENARALDSRFPRESSRQYENVNIELASDITFEEFLALMKALRTVHIILEGKVPHLNAIKVGDEEREFVMAEMLE